MIACLAAEKLFISDRNRQSEFFKFEEKCYHVSHYYFRIEFQMRGAPHVHSLLWLKDSNGEEAPAFWNSSIEDNEEINNVNTSVGSPKLASPNYLFPAKKGQAPWPDHPVYSISPATNEIYDFIEPGGVDPFNIQWFGNKNDSFFSEV